MKTPDDINSLLTHVRKPVSKPVVIVPPKEPLNEQEATFVCMLSGKIITGAPGIIHCGVKSRRSCRGYKPPQAERPRSGRGVVKTRGTSLLWKDDPCELNAAENT